jgi:hypothetical protein
MRGGAVASAAGCRYRCWKSRKDAAIPGAKSTSEREIVCSGRASRSSVMFASGTTVALARA